MRRIVHLLHGMPGCGKTRFAIALVRQGRCVHLCHDEWIVALLGRNPAAADLHQLAGPLFEMLWRQAEQVVGAGCDVVLDFGFWTRQARDEARARVHRMDAEAKFYRFECTAAQAWERVARRNAASDGHSLHIVESTFRLLAGKVEPPMPDESFAVVRPDA